MKKTIVLSALSILLTLTGLTTINASNFAPGHKPKTEVKMTKAEKKEAKQQKKAARKAKKSKKPVAK
jgi:hypothetical protein